MKKLNWRFKGKSLKWGGGDFFDKGSYEKKLEFQQSSLPSQLNHTVYSFEWFLIKNQTWKYYMRLENVVVIKLHFNITKVFEVQFLLKNVFLFQQLLFFNHISCPIIKIIKFGVSIGLFKFFLGNWIKVILKNKIQKSFMDSKIKAEILKYKDAWRVV